MPLNYSKWDQLELSDDSDIEGHPNVDKKSLIRWKQRDIHEKREARKARIQNLSFQIDCNNVLLPRLRDTLDKLTASENPLAYLSGVVEQLQTNPSDDAPATGVPGQQTYDAMVGNLLLQVSDEAKKAAAAAKGGEPENEVIGIKLKEGLKKHLAQLAEHTEKSIKELEAEEKEQKKHITSEDIHEGFDSKYTPAKPEPVPIKNAKLDDKPKPKPKSKSKTTSIEVLNPKSSSSAASVPKALDEDDEIHTEDEEEPLPALTPSLIAFSRLPLYAYEMSWKFIQAHRDVVVPGASDALLVAAFKAQAKAAELAREVEVEATQGKGKGKGKSKKEKEKEEEEKYAKQCVCQSLLLSYCDKLGGDGVRVFFQKMVSGDKRAELVFVKDVEDTYKHLITRVLASLSPSDSSPAEQIQLFPENPSSSITFNVPDGPPPETITLSGPGTEDLDPEEVRKALQMRWDVFSGLSAEMQEALKEGTLDGVNKVLGAMKVEEAEEVVNLLDVGGILSFVGGGIRDQTGQGGEDDDEADDEAATEE